MSENLLPLGRPPRVAIVGYYGGHKSMTYRNLQSMIKMAEEILRDDFKLDLEQVVWISNGGTWAWQIPCSLFLKYGHNRPEKGLLIMPCEWDNLREFARFESSLEKQLSGPQFTCTRGLSKSHCAVFGRLKDTAGGHPFTSSKSDLAKMINMQCERRTVFPLKDLHQAIAEEADFLLYFPLTCSEEDWSFGYNLFQNFKGQKRRIPLDQFLQL